MSKYILHQKQREFLALLLQCKRNDFLKREGVILIFWVVQLYVWEKKKPELGLYY